jgi:hypothetical protein
MTNGSSDDDKLFGEHFYSGHYGPYGSNIGDMWYASDKLNEMVRKEKGPGWACLIYVRDDGTGKPEESVFVTENPELIKEARLGTIKWAQAHAKLN